MKIVESIKVSFAHVLYSDMHYISVLDLNFDIISKFHLLIMERKCQRPSKKIEDLSIGEMIQSHPF